MSFMIFNGRPFKDLAHKLVTTPFQQGWQWVVEFDNTHGITAPNEFEIYAKSIEHGGATIDFEEKQVGGNSFNAPMKKNLGDITLTLRDHEDGRCETFCKKLNALILNDDGTVNLPVDYLFTIRIYRLYDDDRKVLYREEQVSMGEYGPFTRSVDEVGAFVSFPAVFKKYQAF